MGDFPTFDEIFRVSRDEILTKNSNLSLDAVERQGTDVNALVAGQAAIGDEVVGQLVETEASLFLDSSEGEKLDRLVFDRYQLLRKPASSALATVEFSTTAPAPASFSIDIGTKLSTSDGRQFLTLVATTFPIGTTGPVSVATRSALAGLNQAVKKDQIRSIVSSITGSPSDLAVDNPLASSGADDAEQDEALRDRARRFFVTARRGTIFAIETLALAVPGVRTAFAFEALSPDGRQAISNQLLITDAFTETLIDVSPTPASYQLQTQLLAQTVFNSLVDTRAMGIFISVTLASVILQGVTLGLRFQAGVNVDLVAFRARVSIVNYTNALASGETWEVSKALDALKTVPGLVVTGGEILSPAGDVVPQALEVIRTTTGLVVASTIQPDIALQGNTNPDGV